jgi:DNA adenine methylase
LKDHPDDLIDELERLQRRYNRLDKTERANFFYSVREEYNYNLDESHIYKEKKVRVNRAAQMIFLNKTCFNGLFRVNRKGEFNVPFGDYENPKFYDEQNFNNISNVLQNCEIRRGDFEELRSIVNEDSFVYFDPPYRPISKTSSFISYSKNEFDDDEQIRLSETYKYLDDKGAKLMLSNSDPKNYDPKDDFFEELYEGYQIYRVNANRMINCNGEKRGKINEILILNYQYDNKSKDKNYLVLSQHRRYKR